MTSYVRSFFFFISVRLSISSWEEYKQEELEPIIYLEIKCVTSGGKCNKGKELEKCAFWWIITSTIFNGMFVRVFHEIPAAF